MDPFLQISLDYLNFHNKMIENIQEDFGQTSANALRTQSPPMANPAPQRISKIGGPRVSIQQRASQKASQLKNSKLKTSMPAAFQKASWDLAVENTNKKMNRYYKGKEVSLWVDLQHFKIYGPGIYLFFCFLKSLTIAFLLMSIIELSPIIYNYSNGSALSNMTVSINYYFAKTTLAALSPSTSSSQTQDKMVNVIADMVCIFVFICFYFFWLKWGNQLTDKVRKQVKLKSYTVVELLNPPPKSTEEDVHAFMGQFGRVVEVAAVKNFDESIHLSKKIYDLQIQLKQAQLKLQQEFNPDLQRQIKETKEKIDQVYKQLVLYQDDIKEETIKYYVSFSSIEQREKVLKTLQPYKPSACDCCSDLPPENYLMNGERVKVDACHTQPGDVIWQNQHVTWRTRWMRALFQFIFLLAIIAIGFLVISFLNILAPSSATTVDTSSYTWTTIQAVTNTTVLQSWCISNQATVLTKSDSALYTLCWGYIRKYFIKIAITICIAVAVLIIKSIIKVIVTYLAKFQRYKSHTQQSKDITLSLFLTYLCTTVLITFLLQAQFGNVSFKNLISIFISSDYLNENLSSLNTYSDFLLDWYPNIGYQIVFTWIVMIFHPCLTMPLVNHLLQCYKEWKAKDEEVHAKMEKRLEPQQFQIEDNYANVLMIVFVSLALSSGIPLITIVSFFALGLRYLYLKYTFIRFCKIPKTYDQALDLKVSGLLPFGVVVHFAFGIWMFGVSTILKSDSSSFESWVSSLNIAFFKQIAFIIARFFATWYYSAFFLVVFVVFFFKIIIFNLIAKSFMKDSKDVVEIRALGTSSDDFYNKSSKNICDSYKIQNNPDYTEVLSIMHKKRKFVVRVKAVDGSTL